MSRRYGRSSSWRPDVLDAFPLLIPAVLRHDSLAAKEDPLQELIQLNDLVRCRLYPQLSVGARAPSIPAVHKSPFTVLSPRIRSRIEPARPFLRNQDGAFRLDRWAHKSPLKEIVMITNTMYMPILLTAALLAGTGNSYGQNGDDYNARVKQMRVDVTAENARYGGVVEGFKKRKRNEFTRYMNEIMFCKDDACKTASIETHRTNDMLIEKDENTEKATHENNLDDIAHRYGFSDIYASSPCTLGGGGMPCQGTCESGGCKK